jgi:hypothetical protein
MKKILIALATGSLVIAAGCNNGVAQDEEKASEPTVPVELYACTYNEGMGPADLDAATAKWNAWADERGVNDYSAWTLTKFYSGPEQEFDVIWLGVSPTAKALGAGQDDYLANGTEIEAGFAKVLTCDAHINFAAVEFKAPPEREEPSDNIVISFSDCNIAEGKSFDDDVAPAIRAWAEYRTETGSEAGRWVLFPAYGGGGEEFDYKSVTAHQNHEEKGADWDSYAAGGFKKAGELFRGVSNCDSSRVYNATNRRRAVDAEE